MELINSIERLGELELHDSVLGNVEFSVQKRSCAVKLLIYEGANSRDRMGVTLYLGGIVSCLATLDFPSLIDNARSGNVANCRVDVEQGVVRLYLADGLLEVRASSVSLVRD